MPSSILYFSVRNSVKVMSLCLNIMFVSPACPPVFASFWNIISSQLQLQSTWLASWLAGWLVCPAGSSLLQPDLSLQSLPENADNRWTALLHMQALQSCRPTVKPTGCTLWFSKYEEQFPPFDKVMRTEAGGRLAALYLLVTSDL